MPTTPKPCRGGATPNLHGNPNGCASPYRGDPSQSPGCVALQGRPNPGLVSPHAKKPYRDGATPNRHANPNGRASPYRGDSFQSPGCVALQGRPNPGLVSPHAKKPYRDDPLSGRGAHRGDPYGDGGLLLCWKEGLVDALTDIPQQCLTAHSLGAGREQPQASRADAPTKGLAPSRAPTLPESVTRSSVGAIGCLSQARRGISV